MGQQSNKVQKRRRRLNYLKRKKLASKTSAVTAKAAPSKAPAAKKQPATAKPAEKAAPAPKPAEKVETPQVAEAAPVSASEA